MFLLQIEVCVGQEWTQIEDKVVPLWGERQNAKTRPPWVFLDYSELSALGRRGTCVESSGQINSRIRWQRKHTQMPWRAGGKSALKMSRRHVFSSQLLRSFNSWVQKHELLISWLCLKFQVKGEVKTMIRRFPLLLVPHFQQDKVSHRMVLKADDLTAQTHRFGHSAHSQMLSYLIPIMILKGS